MSAKPYAAHELMGHATEQIEYTLGAFMRQQCYMPARLILPQYIYGNVPIMSDGEVLKVQTEQRSSLMRVAQWYFGAEKAIVVIRRKHSERNWGFRMDGLQFKLSWLHEKLELYCNMAGVDYVYLANGDLEQKNKLPEYILQSTLSGV